jgi:hypothetical protein
MTKRRRPTAKPPVPFDVQVATRSIVRVKHGKGNWGCGFVAAGRYVIPAAHCLPRIPAHHFDELATTIRSWDGKDKTKLVVIYCDPISDIAVLKNETLSGGDLPQEWTEAFDRLVTRTGSARIDLSFPVDTPLRFYIRTHTEAWCTGSTKALNPLGPIFCAFIDEGKQIPDGTSGSPVFNQKGEVIGLVSEGGECGGTNPVTVAWLAGALPMWHIRALDDWRNELAAEGTVGFG